MEAAAAAAEPEPEPEAMDVADDGDEAAENALRENIKAKGTNAYYYAHAHRSDAPAWDGQEAPRLLEKKASISDESARKVPITKYAWSDDGGKVKIYIDLANIGEVLEDGVSIEFEDTSLTLSVQVQNAIHELQIPSLYEKIEDAKFRQKPDKIIVTLKKANTFSWHELKKKS